MRRLLVRATNWVGDAVMALPALHALREQFPDAYIAVLAKPWVAGLYRRESFCDELIAYQPGAGWRGWGDRWTIARELQRRNFDCAVLLQNAFEAAAIAYAARIPWRIGYNRDGRGILLTHPIPVPLSGEVPVHQRFYYLELLKRAKLIGDYSMDVPARLSGTDLAAENGRRQFAQFGVEEAVVGVSPGAAYGGAKRWLPERFAAAAVSIAHERKAFVAIFGSEQERGICEEVCAAVREGGIRCRSFAGKTDLAEFIEMAAACEIYLTNDSGPMHIASALGVPTVAIFGATDDRATGPTGLHARVVREPVECSPCLLRECPIDHRCMTRVHSQQVVQVALDMLPKS